MMEFRSYFERRTGKGKAEKQIFEDDTEVFVLCNQTNHSAIYRAEKSGKNELK